MTDKAIQVVVTPDIDYSSYPWVRATKLGEAPNAEIKAPKKEDYVPGEDNGPGTTLPVEYWAEGRMIESPKIGGRLRIWRYIRNGVHAIGIFETSFIKKIEGDTVFTGNSRYQVEEKDAPKEYDTKRVCQKEL